MIKIVEKNIPEKKFRTGPISSTIWKNKGKDKFDQEVTYRTVSFDRRYKDKGGEWKSTNSLRVNDLPKAVLVLNEAYRYLSFKEFDRVTDSSPSEGPEEEHPPVEIDEIE